MNNLSNLSSLKGYEKKINTQLANCLAQCQAVVDAHEGPTKYDPFFLLLFSYTHILKYERSGAIFRRVIIIEYMLYYFREFRL